MIQTLASFVALAVPLCLLTGAVASRGRNPWQAARRTSALALLFALVATVLAPLNAAELVPGLLRTTPLSLIMALLITVITFVLVRFSQQYLGGEPGERRYLALLQLTPAAVAVVVLADHMLVLVAGWMGISLSLHQLLLFYPDRPRAALAAHKKFLFARLAELCLLSAAVLLYMEHGSWHISAMLAAYPSALLSPLEQAAALLLACAALIKCAQLPVHGWLIQVVESPTPVSALLHGGIINLGGYLLILFGPLLVQATAAQWLVLVVAGGTALVAALVMATRISVKVRLAWSTSAQMGLMLVECALGQFQLALLHLLAHTCYKACAFLEAGSAVEKHLQRQLAPNAAPAAGDWLRALLLALPLTAVVAALAQDSTLLAPWLLVGLALTLALAERGSRRHRAALLPVLLAGAAALVAYAAQKWLVGQAVPALPASAGVAADAWVCLLILVLAATWWLLRHRAHWPLSQQLAVWLYAGLYLDEWATRITLRIWPTRLPVRANPKRLPQ